MVRNVDSPSKFLMYPRFLQVVMDHKVDDMTTHHTRYTSPALTQKVFVNMRRVGKGFLGVETPLFASMLVQLQPQTKEGVKVPIAPTPPSTTSAPSPPDLHDPTPTPHAIPPQDQPLTPHDSPPQDHPITPHESTMPLLTTLMKTSIDADEGITLVDVETDKETLIKLKAEKAKFLDKQIAQKLHDEEVQKAAARDKQEKVDMERDLELQKLYDDKEENIDWSDVVEQVQERHLDSIRKYKNLKKKPVLIAQAMKNMIIYLKNMACYKMEFFRGMTYDKESFKKLRAAEVLVSESTQEIPSNHPKAMIEEDVQNIHDPDAEWKLQVEEDNEMSRDLVIKIFMEANKPRSRTKDNDVQRLKENAQRNYCSWFKIITVGSTLMLLDKVGAAVEVLKIYSKSLLF
uniref:Uncharacterized protein n=1 Tax=Tanacetum cinerariifolium TaxID=118510 RepID=A0A699I6I1_TANCI|nr:hypothetical protein [Tanacetum cinerariifolium]